MFVGLHYIKAFVCYVMLVCSGVVQPCINTHQGFSYVSQFVVFILVSGVVRVLVDGSNVGKTDPSQAVTGENVRLCFVL